MGSMCNFIVDNRITTGKGKSPATAVSQARQKHNEETGPGSGQAANRTDNIQINRQKVKWAGSKMS